MAEPLEFGGCRGELGERHRILLPGRGIPQVRHCARSGCGWIPQTTGCRSLARLAPTWNSGVDAAIFWGNGKGVLFQGGVVSSIRHRRRPCGCDLSSAVELAVLEWVAQGWESGVDVAVNWSHGRAYFFQKESIPQIHHVSVSGPCRCQSTTPDPRRRSLAGLAFRLDDRSRCRGRLAAAT